MPKITDHNREYVNQLLTKELHSAMEKYSITELPEDLRYELGRMADVSINPNGYTARVNGWLEAIDYGFSVVAFDDMLQAYLINTRTQI